jgi:hypothetical protein
MPTRRATPMDCRGYLFPAIMEPVSRLVKPAKSPLMNVNIFGDTLSTIVVR